MGRGVTQNALTNVGMGQDLSKQYNQNAQGVMGTLQPALESEISNPQGFGTAGLNAMNTANQQSTGGATAGAVGEGNLAAARTRNAGGFTSALDEAARQGGRTASQNAVGIQGANAALKNTQQQAGLAGEQGLYNTDVGATMSGLNASNAALNPAVESSKNTGNTIMDWTKLGLQVAGAIPGVCWVAAELYGGWLAPRTVRARSWFDSHPVLRMIYVRFGPRWATVIRKNTVMRWLTRQVFDRISGKES